MSEVINEYIRGKKRMSSIEISHYMNSEFFLKRMYDNFYQYNVWYKLKNTNDLWDISDYLVGKKVTSSPKNSPAMRC